jgi:outer membrane PBP1 activator LpoA protein
VVYLRKNIEAVPNVDSDGTHWRMDEAQLTKDQYAQYQQVRAAAEERSEAIMQALSDAEADRELRAIAEDSNTETVMQAISDLQADIAMMAAE